MTASAGAIRLVARGRRSRNGRTKLKIRSDHATVPQPPANRLWNQTISSGMLAYQ